MCAEVAQDARRIMRHRQDGYSIEYEWSQATTELQRALVILAYKETPYSSGGFKAQAVEDFVTTRFLECQMAQRGIK